MNAFHGIPRNLPKPGEGMYYVAKRPLKVTPTDQRDIGSEVPEAFEWKKTRSMIALGMLEFVPSKLPEPPKKPVKNQPGMDAPREAAPSQVAHVASVSGAEPVAKPEAKSHGKPKGAPK